MFSKTCMMDTKTDTVPQNAIAYSFHVGLTFLPATHQVPKAARGWSRNQRRPSSSNVTTLLLPATAIILKLLKIYGLNI